MENENNDTLLEQSLRFIEFYNDCKSKMDLKLSKESVQALHDKIERGFCLNIIVCGVGKSGKSTLLNYMLGHEGDARIFPPGVKAETYSPWNFREDRNLSLDSLQISHLEPDGKESEKRLFHSQEFNKFRSYVAENYIRSKAVKVTKQNGNTILTAYSQINISYGAPLGESTKRLYSPLFDSGVNIVDLQGFNQLEIVNRNGAEVTLEEMDRPFILICTFDCSRDFFSENDYNVLKTMIHNSKPIHLIFVATHVEENIKNTRRCENWDNNDFNKENENCTFPMFSFFKKEKKNEPPEKKTDKEILAELFRNLKRDLAKDFAKDQFDLFLFEFDSKFPEICKGAEKMRDRVFELKQHLNLPQLFCEEMSWLLSAQLTSLRTTLMARALRETDPSSFQEFDQHRAKLPDPNDQNLVKTLRSALDSHLWAQLKSHGENRKSLFMKDNPTRTTLLRRLSTWFINDGFKITISEVVIKKIEEFERMQQKKIQLALENIAQELNLSVGPFPSFNMKEFFKKFTSIVRQLQEPVKEISLKGFLSGLTGTFLISFGSLGFFITAVVKNYFFVADFDQVLVEWLEKIRDMLLSDEMILPICHQVAKTFIEKQGGANEYLLESMYLKANVKDDSKIADHLQDKYKINLEELNKMNDVLRSIRKNDEVLLGI